MSSFRYLIIRCAVLVLSVVSVRADDPEIPLHQHIDRLITEATPEYEQYASRLAADDEFLRRICLDVTGRIPTAEQARTFFADRSEFKRVELVDRLLRSPEHVRHLQHHFDVMLMQRRRKKYIDPSDWRAYLRASIRENKSWDNITRELLSVDGADRDKRAAARFLLDRQLNADETTRDLARVFLGRDLQCAQCHDHPHIGDYAQQHYFGISAFLNRSYLFTDPKTKLTSIGEKAEGTVKFTSVFTSLEAETAPKMLDLEAIEDPPPEQDPYVAKPDKQTRGVPKYSRRALLADAVTDPDNRAFRLNIANRLWALVMGRGLVEPLDMFHSDNPPSHPKLLELLADDLAEHDYDMRRTIRQVVLSRTYQRSSRFCSGEAAEDDRYFTGLLKPLSPEQLAWSMMVGTGVVAQTHTAMAEKLQTAEPTLDPGSDNYAFRLENSVNEQLHPHVNTFISVFASTNESSRFDATAEQALFVLNGPLIGEWLQPAEGRLVTQLQPIDDSGQMAKELFLSLLTRLPTESETAALTGLLNESGMDRVAVLQQVVRSILCSAEFRFNH